MQEYFQAHNLGEVEAETLLCCETVSEKKAGSLLSGWLETDMDTTTYIDLVLTAQSLVWARSGDRSGLHVVGAKLMNIRTRSQVSLFSKDFGLEINGLIEDAKSNIRGIIGLGPEPAAQKFCDEVYQAIEKINPTPVRKFPAWMGGNR
jgi:hypothetical protein